MSSTQFSDKPGMFNYVQHNPAAPPPATWNVPPGGPGQYLSPNPQMWNQPAPQQWNNPTVTIIPATSQPTLFHQEFMKGKPKGLGITLIIMGILHIGMGIGLLFMASYSATYSGISFWGAILSISAGSLSVAAVSEPSMCLIKGALGMSIVVSIVSVCGLILNIVDFFVYYYCYGGCGGLIIVGDVLRGFFIITYLLQFSISVSISVFACRAEKYRNPTVPTQVIMIQNPATVLQPSTVSGSYPTPYPSSQPYMMQSGVSDGPRAFPPS